MTDGVYEVHMIEMWGHTRQKKKKKVKICHTTADKCH